MSTPTAELSVERINALTDVAYEAAAQITDYLCHGCEYDCRICHHHEARVKYVRMLRALHRAGYEV